ncbi:hypothetical protein A7982_13637 [Minicystis rosea]|nr:hypothetical protein A7982_13637 [Minicystis rosea]
MLAGTLDVVRARALVFVAFTSAAFLALGCSTTVIGGGSGGAGGTRGEGGTLEGPGDEPPNATTGGGPATLAHVCSATGAVCSTSDVFPEGEGCFACSCRCCNDTTSINDCLADATCAAWLDCMRGCTDEAQCWAQCGAPCATGTEAACYLMDCHNWMCGHGCGHL